MQKLTINLENCYGIKEFKEELDFSKNKANIIYAPNGTMKSSLALTFKDFSQGKDSSDRIYPDRKSTRLIKTESNVEPPKEQVFVIEPYTSAYESERVSTLLVNQELKKEYDAILKTIEEKKENLLKEVKKTSGVKSNCGEVISEVFTKEKSKFLVAIGRIEAEVLEEVKSDLAKIPYNQIFNSKVEDFLKSGDFKTQLENYTKIYDKLLGGSVFFRKGVFNHYQASEIAKILKTHGFFKAEHSVYVNLPSERKEVKTEKDLEEVIVQEKQRILSDEGLKKSFDEIDNKLKNEDLRAFREFLLNNQFILPELSNLDLLKQKLWKAYLVEHKDLFKSLIDEYSKGKSRIQEISEKASKEATLWQDVINIFNRRFSVPFKVSIENKQDVMLRSVSPNLRFEFFDDVGKEKLVEKSQLVEVLSNGEKRALYILNIIFELEARKKSGIKSLLIVDDIADSFDYKNKYAIIEYLNDILSFDKFNMIILTHNYDFYRSVSTRLELGGSRFHTIRHSNSIKLLDDKIYKNPFKKWKDSISKGVEQEVLVVLILFMRNLAEYCGREPEEGLLTSLLHLKENTDSITIKEFNDVLKVIINHTGGLPSYAQDKKIKDIIYEVAEKLSKETDITVELEKKIALSIAIRLHTENFLIRKINDDTFVKGITSNQTGKLIRRFREKFQTIAAEIENVKTIERVNLMTPENIHLNSFMYEPILDMSIEHLRKLYVEVKNLT